MSELRFETAGVLGMGLMSALFSTTRARRLGDDHYLQFRRRGEPVLFVLWHGQLLPLIWYHRHEGVVVLVSEHEDGEYVTRVIERQGFDTVRGSSSRGATRALKGLIRAARAGHDLAVTPDGPRGPAREFKVGALGVAQATGMPVIPVAVRSPAGWRLRSWDRFLVPRPVSTLTLEYGAPVRVPRHADREALDRIGAEIQGTLNRLSDAEAGPHETPGAGPT